MTPDDTRLTAAVGQWADIADGLLDRCGRPDLADSARSLGGRVAGGVVRVVVIGDFKQGKSSLVNALVGDEPCSTAVTASTLLPTVCRSAESSGVWVVERHDDGLRRRAVSTLEAHSAQNGSWAGAVAVESETASARFADQIEIVDCPAASGRRSSREATVDAARTADVALVVTDATQPLTEPEAQVLADVAARVPTVVALSKCDLAVHWREVRTLDEQMLSSLGVPCRIVPVSAELGVRGETDGVDDESGIRALVTEIRSMASAARESFSVTDAMTQLWGLLDEARGGQVRAAEAFGDVTQLRERARQAEVAYAELDEVRGPAAGWQRLLDRSCEGLATELRDLTRARLNELRGRVSATLDRIDPAKDWETFEPWLRDEAGAVGSSVVAEAERRVQASADEVAAAFSASDHGILEGFTRPAPAAGELEVGPEGDAERRLTRFLREGFATLGSTSGGLLAFATLGGVISAAVLAPLTVVLGAGLGGTAVVSERRNERAARRARAEEAVDRYLEEVERQIDEVVSAGLCDFRVRTRDDLIARADARARAARDELEAARRALDDAESARSQRQRVADRIVEIDDLIGRMRTVTEG